ncbi:DNA-directed DNA polymerase [Malassezia cuniculi]|uniref:DNA polymerase epsilon subunit n=1 Tax=Malassezia cuniculi TaxID=948313 RepID=A0AAF0F188_9BASI|nr:DNA-directed DNA polymerase [Malassezia cuniculi]
MDATRVPPDVRRVVLRVFTRKHHLQLRSDAVVFVYDTLADHNLLEDEAATLEAIEALASAVVEQHVASGDVPGFDGLVVTRDALQHVYDQLLVQGESSSAAAVTQGDAPDPERFFSIVDAFAQPRVVYDHSRRVFERAGTPHVLSAANASSASLRERYEMLRNVVLRNEHFAPKLVPGSQSMLKLATTKDLLGRQGENCLLFGRLSTTADGRYALEDAEGSIPLELQDAVPGEGIFTEGAMVLVEGVYTDTESLRVLAIGHPPSESREAAQRMYGHVDFCGTGALAPKSIPALRAYEAQHSDQCISVFSDVHLDHEKSIAQLHAILQGYDRAGFIPFAVVLCGNFCSPAVAETDGEQFERYKNAFARLADVLVQFPRVLASCHFVFVPGPADPVATPLCPRPRIPAPLVERFERRLPRSFVESRLHWASNPCRIVYFSQEIVVFRDDIMSRMLRSAVQLGPVRDRDLHKYLVSTLLDQANLSPLPHQVRPVLWEHGHALRLYPMPSALVLADRCEHYELTYEGCHVFNPGPFRGGLFSWTTYYPATGHAERSELSV